MKRVSFALCVLVCALSAWGGPGDEPAAKPKATQERAAEPTPKPEPAAEKPARRDPFSTPASIRRAAEVPASASPAGGSRSAQAVVAVAPPELRVKGLLVLRGGKAGALVDVGGLTRVIRVGDHLTAAGGAPTWRVSAITAAGLELVSGELTHRVR